MGLCVPFPLTCPPGPLTPAGGDFGRATVLRSSGDTSVTGSLPSLQLSRGVATRVLALVLQAWRQLLMLPEGFSVACWFLEPSSHVYK